MKKEIEIKILNINPRKLRTTVKKLGGRQILRPTLMRELYFESPMKDRIYSSFRLRYEGKKNLLTLKIKKQDKRFEVRDEYEVVVGDFDMTKNILELAGFKVFRNREKKRESFRVGKIRIDLDTYPGMNPYAEIESESRGEIEKFLNQIGFSLSYATKKTATEIIRDAGLNPDNLIFPKK